jgi:hypothetical protein
MGEFGIRNEDLLTGSYRELLLGSAK